MEPRNADLTVRAAVETATLPWSPRRGFDEKLLELAPGRYTALVRLAAGTTFPDELTDVLVLDGMLHAGSTACPGGTYLHAPGPLVTETGCTLFVKRRPLGARTPWVADTRRSVFERSHTAGLSEAALLDTPDGKVVLLRFAPGTRIGHHHHRDGEELFVLAGEVTDEHGRYATHAWVRQPPGSSHRVESVPGCLFFTFAHHLAGVR